MVYCRPYYSQESRKANEKFVMDCHYSICDTYGGCRGVTSKLNLSLHLTAFVFWNTYFFPGDHNTNRIPYIFKAYSRRIEFEQRRIFSLTDCKKGTSFPFFACRKKTRCTRSDFPICANWRLCILTKSNMKTLRKKTVDPLLLLLLLLLPPVQSILTEPDCFEGLLFLLWFWYVRQFIL